MVELLVVAVEVRQSVVAGVRANAKPWHASSLGSWAVASTHSEYERASSYTTLNPPLPSPAPP